MSKRLIGLAEFEAMFDAGKLDTLTRKDLDRLDYDPPKERVALVSWCAERSDDDGEVFPGFWRVVMAGDGRRFDELHDWGVLQFGKPPWKRSAVVRVVGRLGSVEAFVAAMAEPGPSFVYDFQFVEGERPKVPAARGGDAKSFKTSRLPRNVEAQERMRWRRTRERKPREPGQGELF